MNDRVMLENTGIVVLDEVSMVTPRMFATLNSRLQQGKGNNQDFGGLSIILVGDFFQLPPVLGDGLYAGAMKELIAKDSGTPFRFGTPYQQGVELFRKFSLFVLKEQKRCKDPVHMDLVARMGQGESIKASDLGQIKMLKTEDFDEDPTW